MSDTLHTLAIEILKSRANMSELSTSEIHRMYREIYAALQKAEQIYVKENPGMKIMK